MNNALPKRPLSVWLITSGNYLFAAVMIATSFMAEAKGFTAGQAAIPGILGLGIALASVATWYGYRTGRLVLLILLTIFLGLLITQSIMYIDWADKHRYPWGVNLAIFRLIGSLIWLALNWVFLFRKRARAFFG